MRDMKDPNSHLAEDLMILSVFGEQGEKELVGKLEMLYSGHTGDLSGLMTHVLGTDWNRVREVVGDNAVKIGVGALASLEKGDMLLFKLVSRLIIRPLLEKYDAAMRMVETLTVSKEIGEAQEEDND